ncbi:MAG: ABC transporter ATP-binding protein [Clostridiales bacterium]|nr:ABC transporter ATP-binding protein [Clostridiales bacterium]
MAMNKPVKPSGGPGARMRFEKPKNAKVTLVRLLAYIAKSKWLLAAVAVLVAISSFSEVAGTYLLKPIVNLLADCVKTGDIAGGLKQLSRTLIMLAVIYVCGAIAQYVYARMMLSISQNTLNRIRRDLFEHLEDLPIGYFDTHTHGELMSRFTSDVDTIREVISQGMVQTASSVITVVSTFVMMLVISWQLTLIIIGMLFVMFFVIKFIGGRSSKLFRAQQKNMGIMNGYAEEYIEGQKVIKLFCREERTKSNYAALTDEYRIAATDANTYASILMPIMGNISYINYAATSIVGAILIINGAKNMSIGSLASFLQYTRQFSRPITQVSQQFNNILAALAGAERIFEIIDEAPETDDGYVTLVNAVQEPDGTLRETKDYTGIWAWKHPHSADGSITYTRLRGDVRFENVVFSYDGKKDVLNGISLYAKPGQKLAFVGSTGAGKTTITNLINRFYDVSSGKITYDGINVKKIKKDDLRDSLAMVLQDTHLFTGTVEENIKYGKLDATHEQVERAAKLANAHSFISRLPQGYDTVLTGDGANLSQGQRQLISIARAAVANPPVLILDEATSSIDTRTERLIEKGMDKLMEGRTVFVIAHRLSTVRNSDAIIVLENGEIIERGNHDELIERGGKYYSLYTGQFELS